MWCSRRRSITICSGLPELGSEIAKILQIDIEPQRRLGHALRGSVRTSGFVRGSRVIERLQSRRSTLWMSFDAVPREGQREPTDPVAATAVPFHDTNLGLFLLPNRHPAFFALDHRGARANRLPAELPRRSVAPRGPVQVGLDCLSCHGGGPRTPTLDESATKPNVVAALAAALATDQAAVREGHRNGGAVTDAVGDVGEPMSGLARQFARPLSADRLAVELGVTPEALASASLDPKSPVGDLVRRSLQGLVARAEVEAEFNLLLGAVGTAAPAASQKPSLMPADDRLDPAPSLHLLSDKLVYKSGDALQLTVRSAVDCHLTLISLDKRGRGTVIFPSDFEHNDLLAAGRPLVLPRPGSPYVLRLREIGRERIVALCTPSAGAVDGIRHDFERQRFTDLGTYAAFLAQAIAADQQARRAPKPAAAMPEPKKARERAEASTTRPRPEDVARTAITLEIAD